MNLCLLVKRIQNEYDVGVWTGFSKPRIESRALWVGYWPFGFQKILSTSWPTEQLSYSQKNRVLEVSQALLSQSEEGKPQLKENVVTAEGDNNM
jgi:hypothetical protein